MPRCLCLCVLDYWLIWLVLIEQAHLKHSAFTIGSKDSLFSLAAADPAWMNAFLCLISLHHDLQSRKGISRECLMHRAEALRIVNQRLIDAPRQISESTIGAIAFLANFDVSEVLFIYLLGIWMDWADCVGVDDEWVVCECDDACAWTGGDYMQ